MTGIEVDELWLQPMKDVVEPIKLTVMRNIFGPEFDEVIDNFYISVTPGWGKHFIADPLNKLVKPPEIRTNGGGPVLKVIRGGKK